MKTFPISENTHTTQFLDIISRLPALNIEQGPWIAGGAARRLHQGQSLATRYPARNEEDEERIVVADIDVFFTSWKQFSLWKTDLEGTRNCREITITRNAVTCEIKVNGVRYPVQLIKKKFYPDLQAVFDNFDFSVCKFATDGGAVYCDDGADQDLKDMRLRATDFALTNPKYFSSRFTKYLKYGFHPQPGMLSRALESLSQQGHADYDGSYDGL